MTAFAVFALGCLAGAPRSAQAADAAAGVVDLAPVATELALLDQGATPASVAQRLATLGPEPAALVFEALGRTELPLADGALALGERERVALLDAARRLGRGPFVPLWSAAAAATDVPRRRTAIELVGDLGTPSDAQTAVRAATPSADAEPTDPQALQLLEDAAAQLLARAPQTLPALRPEILRARPVIAGVLIRAVGHAPDERTLAFLVELLGFDERLDLPLLSTLEGTARQSSPPFAEDVCAAVRGYVNATDRQLARAAAMTLGALQDEESMPALIELCAHQDRTLSGAAFAALERTTGLAFPRRAERWRAWLQSEHRWALAEGARIAAALDGDDVVRTLGALRELAGHRYGRHRIAPQVARLLEHSDPRVRGEACRTLGALGTARVRVALERAAVDPEPAVAAAAEAALGAL